MRTRSDTDDCSVLEPTIWKYNKKLVLYCFALLPVDNASIEVVEIDIDDSGVFGIWISFHKDRVSQPFLHACDTTKEKEVVRRVPRGAL